MANVKPLGKEKKSMLWPKAQLSTAFHRSSDASLLYGNLPGISPPGLRLCYRCGGYGGSKRRVFWLLKSGKQGSDYQLYGNPRQMDTASRFIITGIYETSVCPLAKVMRRRRTARPGRRCLKVAVTEEPIIRETPPGSIAFVPSVAGLLIAGK